MNYINQLKEKLIYYQDDDLVMYYGQAIEANNNIKWFIPIIYKKRAFHLLFVNIKNPYRLDNIAYSLSVIQIENIFMTLSKYIHRNYVLQKFHKITTSTKKKSIVIVESDIANFIYPEVISNLTFAPKRLIVNLIKKLERILEFKAKGIDFYLDNNLINQNVIIDGLYLYKKEFHDDIWRRYYLIVKSNLENLKGKEVLLRIDSGCVIGQLYNDRECDCREQFYKSINSYILENNGILIHIPTQDGRGYGTALKAESELYKRGLNGRINKVSKNLDTIQASKLLYKNHDLDLRSYKGVVRILKSLNIDVVSIITNNKKKLVDLKNNNIKVRRLKFDYDSCKYAKRHLLAKHKHKDYF